ncbi:hypothetical protein HLB42_20725 (plasmid) [Deinococcus sp. D7000]|nr:hypothetical protein HLB42_20725 [Deinococcus sp. D7000]
MKASEWLVRATQDLPAGVTARVKADTLAHLQDAGVDEWTDVRPLLGRPADTAAELKRLYLRNAEWLNLVPRKTFWTITATWLNALMWPAFLLWSLLEPRSPLNTNGWLWGGLTLGVTVMALVLAQLPAARRRLWLSPAGGLVYLTVFVLMGLMPVWPGIFFYLLALTVREIWRIWHTDARLARTLSVEGKWI